MEGASAASLSGQVVVVTGAASGFGRAFALEAARLGAKVVLSDLTAPHAVQREIEAAGGTATAFGPCDTSNWEHQLAMFKHAQSTYGSINVVFPNAGVGETGKWLEPATVRGTDGSLQPRRPPMLTISVNLIGATYTVALAMHYLRQSQDPRKSIVFIGSRYSTIPIPSGPMYTMAKHGVLGLFKSVYYEAQKEGINTNIILPWFTETGIIAPLTRVAIFALPLCSVADVVSCVVKSASDPTFNGNMVFVDAEGVVAVPFETVAMGETGYSKVIAERAKYTTSYSRIVKDTNLLLRQTLGFWLATRRSKLFATLALVGLLARIVRGRAV